MGLLSWLTGKKAAAPKEEAEASDEREQEAPPDEAEQGVPIAELEQALQAKNGAERVDAARMLLERWRRGDGEAARALHDRLPALLEDDETQVRQAALGAVRLLRRTENLEKLASAVLAALADKAAPVRTAAVWAALRLPGETARGQVRALLQSGDEPLRFDAASALAEVGDSAAMPFLIESLREGHRRQEALSALMSLGDAAALPALAQLWESEEEHEALGDFDRTLLAAALARFGDVRGAEHLAARAAEAGDDRPVAVEWAGRLGVQQAIPALEELSEDEGEAARGAALRALGRLKAPGAEERLLRVALDAELADDLRMDASEGLAELGTEPALAALRDLGLGQGELPDLCRELLAELAQAEALKAEAERAAAAQQGAAAQGAPAEGAAQATAAAAQPAPEQVAQAGAPGKTDAH